MQDRDILIKDHIYIFSSEIVEPNKCERKQKGQPEKLETLGTQDEDKHNTGATRKTGNIGYTGRRQA